MTNAGFMQRVATSVMTRVARRCVALPWRPQSPIWTSVHTGVWEKCGHVWMRSCEVLAFGHLLGVLRCIALPWGPSLPGAYKCGQSEEV